MKTRFIKSAAVALVLSLCVLMLMPEDASAGCGLLGKLFGGMKERRAARQERRAARMEASQSGGFGVFARSSSGCEGQAASGCSGQAQYAYRRPANSRPVFTSPVLEAKQRKPAPPKPQPVDRYTAKPPSFTPRVILASAPEPVTQPVQVTQAVYTRPAVYRESAARVDFTGLAAGILAMYRDQPTPAPLPTPVPGPAPPGPSPSADCENCNGTGRLGDGTVFVKCPVCDGTGKKKLTSILRSQKPVRRCSPDCICPGEACPCTYAGECLVRKYAPKKPATLRRSPAQGRYVYRTECSGGSCRRVKTWVQR